MWGDWFIINDMKPRIWYLISTLPIRRVETFKSILMRPFDIYVDINLFLNFLWYAFNHWSLSLFLSIWLLLFVSFFLFFLFAAVVELSYVVIFFCLYFLFIWLDEHSILFLLIINLNYHYCCHFKTQIYWGLKLNVAFLFQDFNFLYFFCILQ